MEKEAHVTGFAALDVETTGLSPAVDRVIEIGVVLLDESGAPESTWETYVNPGVPVRATHIHGISDDDVAGAPSFSDIAERLLGLLEGRAVVGHSVGFDVGFINAELANAGFRDRIEMSMSVCTLDQSRVYLADGRHSLGACAERAGIPKTVSHRALADAETSGALLAHYISLEGAGARVQAAPIDRWGNQVLPAQWERARPFVRSQATLWT